MPLEMEHFSAKSERIFSSARLLPGLIAVILVWWYHDAFVQASPLKTVSLSWGILLFCFGAGAALVDTFVRPTPKMSRVVLGMVLEIVGIGGAIYLGAGLFDPFALGFTLVIVAAGVLFGASLLIVAIGLSVAMFGLIWWISPHWQGQALFSITVFCAQIGLGFYVFTLVRSVHKTRRELEWQANHDALTGTLNRRAFGRALAGHCERAMAPGHNAVLLYMDLDRFKDVNDRAGHAAGDQTLIEVTGLLRERLGGRAVLGRLGGDEFCALLPSAAVTNALAIAEGIRNDIAGYRLAWGTEVYTIGISIGLVARDDRIDATQWLRAADDTCYRAKRSGRNRVVAHGDASRDRPVPG